MLLKILFFALGIRGLNIGYYPDEPYLSLSSSVCGSILEKISRDLGENLAIIPVTSESAGVECVKSGKCDVTIGKFNSELLLSYPILIVKII